MSNEQPEPGSWSPGRVDALKLGDEIWVNGDWRLITATGRSGPVQVVYFDGGEINFPISCDVMVKEK
jgi:hypothetical protein